MPVRPGAVGSQLAVRKVNGPDRRVARLETEDSPPPLPRAEFQVPARLMGTIEILQMGASSPPFSIDPVASPIR